MLEAGRERRTLAAFAIAGTVLLAAQTASLFIEPADPRPFTRPDASGGFGPTLETDQVKAEVARAGRCDPVAAFSGPPYLAFVAGRRMPGGQPDGFLTAESSRLGDVRARVASDLPVCP